MDKKTDPRPVGGTHERTRCTSCGGAWTDRHDTELIYVRFGDPNPDELVCFTCLELTWGEGVGSY